MHMQLTHNHIKTIDQTSREELLRNSISSVWREKTQTHSMISQQETRQNTKLKTCSAKPTHTNINKQDCTEPSDLEL